MLTLFNRKVLIILAVVLTIFPKISVTHAISLQEAKVEALRANLSIKISKEKVSEAQSLTKESYAQLFPELNLSGYSYYITERAKLRVEKGSYGTFPFGPMPSEDVELAATENYLYATGIKLNQTVFTGGRIYYSYRETKSREEEVMWGNEQTIQDILLNVEGAYFALLKAEDMKKLAGQHASTLKAHLADMEQLYQKGRVAFNDVLKVRVEVTRANEEIIKADNDILVAKGQLNLILNRPLGQPIEAVPVDELQVITITMEEAENRAKLQYPALKSARSKRTTALFTRRVAEADYYPNIMFSGGYFTQNEHPLYPNEWWSLMLTVNWSLWQWGETKHKVSAAKAYENQVDYSISSLENQIAAEARKNFLRIQEADKRIEVAKEAMAQAQENLRITQVGFNYGRKTSTDVLDSEELLTKTCSEYVHAIYDAHIARAQLRYVMGEM